MDHEYPEGDRGGNSFPVTSKDSAKNLHAVWDSVLYEYSTDQTLPFSASGWASNGQAAADLVKKYPLSTLADTTNLNPIHWADETFKVAESFVYANIHESTTLPADYVSKGLEIAEKQIVTAGYRLANLMKTLKMSPSSLDELFLQN